ncbi:hypothetical protein [Metabacillus fastidiosus]|uniref:hypothetical protein n=1 Tax=Metabacillus fastidiosus TaxID=1458 RepID=UPI002DB67B43|nr:hypothetical protein [Metabacillus fastidiosus]MEC2074480.1 hypothetical protein [Metabacillus fastidiosus]
MRGKKITSLLVLMIAVLCFSSDVQAAGTKSGMVNLGPQLTNVNVSTATFGTNSNGDPLMFSILQGLPARLIVTNMDTQELVDSQPLLGATTGWSIQQGETGIYYIGTTPNELLFKYEVNRKKLTKVGKATTKDSTVIWDMDYATNNKTLYGVSSYEAKVFKYVDGKGFYDYGTISKGKKDAKSVAYSPKNNSLFIGVGSPVELIAFDIKAKKSQSILPSHYRGEKEIQALNVVDNLLFVKLNPSGEILCFDVNTKRFLGGFAANSFGVSAKSPVENVIYYGFNQSIYSYNLQTKERIEVVKGKVPGTIVSFSFIKDKNNNYTLVGKLGSNERYFTYDLKSKQFKHDMMRLPPQPIELHHIGTDQAGNIYSSGFLNGSMGIYSPNTNQTERKGPTGQVEGMAYLNSKVYLGVYPEAKIIEYNSVNDSSQNIFSLKQYGQDRPTAVLHIPNTNKLYIGTAPRTGIRGGALAILDVNTKKTSVKNQFIPDQSIIALAYSSKQKKVYGGTSVFGKPNADPSKTNAKLFTVPAGQTNAKATVLNLPFKNIRFYSALAVAEDGTVWGLADEILFAYDPAKGLVYSKAIVNDVSGHTPNGSLLIGKDGSISGVVEGTMFKLNPKDKKLTYPRKEKNVKQLIQSPDRTLYFHDGVNLWKYSI